MEMYMFVWRQVFSIPAWLELRAQDLVKEKNTFKKTGWNKTEGQVGEYGLQSYQKWESFKISELESW